MAKNKVPVLKVGQQIRILLGPRKGQTDTVKEVARTAMGSPVYFLIGDKERLVYQTIAVVDEKRAKVIEDEAKKAHWKEYGQDNNSGEVKSTG